MAHKKGSHRFGKHFLTDLDRPNYNLLSYTLRAGKYNQHGDECSTPAEGGSPGTMRLAGKRLKGKTYPNGITKSRLYIVFLSCRNFSCTPRKYEEDIGFIRREEENEYANCAWYRDTDGKLVVDGLELNNPHLRVVITEEGFELMPRPQDAPLVFISYAREDHAAAQGVTNAIDHAGLRPWLDTENLLPGQRWEYEIAEAIKKSRFVVILLSSTAVNKKGHVQKEIRRALEVLMEFPENKRFVIPVRLEPCESTHPELRKLQWLDLFPDWDAGIARLIAALRDPR